MAILPDVHGIEVVVRMNGVLMQEYQDENVEIKEGELNQFQASKTTSKYVESFSDQEFAIELNVHRSFDFNCEALSFEVFVDGKKVRSPCLKKDEYAITGEWKLLVEGVKSYDENEGWKVHKFMFSPIETTMDDYKLYDVQSNAAAMKETGEIAVWVFRKSKIHKVGLMENREKFGVKKDAVHGKALKGQAKSHGTSLGETMESKASTKYVSKKMDGEGRPIAIFKFKYRSADSLRSLLIFPAEPYERPSAPTPDSASRRYATTTFDPDEINLNTASPAEKALMANYLYGLRQEKGSPQVKQEYGVKREGGASSGSRKSNLGTAVVVDLTED